MGKKSPDNRREKQRFSIRKTKAWGACSVFLGTSILFLSAGTVARADTTAVAESKTQVVETNTSSRTNDSSQNTANTAADQESTTSGAEQIEVANATSLKDKNGVETVYQRDKSTVTGNSDSNTNTNESGEYWPNTKGQSVKDFAKIKTSDFSAEKMYDEEYHLTPVMHKSGDLQLYIKGQKVDISTLTDDDSLNNNTNYSGHKSHGHSRVVQADDFGPNTYFYLRDAFESYKNNDSSQTDLEKYDLKWTLQSINYKTSQLTVKDLVAFGIKGLLEKGGNQFFSIGAGWQASKRGNFINTHLQLFKEINEENLQNKTPEQAIADGDVEATSQKLHIGYADIDSDEALEVTESAVDRVYVDNNSKLAYQKTDDGYLAITRQYNTNHLDAKNGDNTVVAILELNVPETGVDLSLATIGNNLNGNEAGQGSKLAPSLPKTVQYVQPLIINYYDETTGEKLLPSTTGHNLIGASYKETITNYQTVVDIDDIQKTDFTTEAPTINGYMLTKTEGNPEGIYYDGTNVINYYYSPIIDPVKKLTSQTVTYVGAGDKTPKPDVQNNHIFTGNHDESTDTTTWEEKDHTYGEVTTPVVSGYYADKQTAGHKTVTPDYPTATDQVTYKELGKVVPVDPEGHPIPGAKTPTYNNDPQDPTKGTTTPIPEVPGYTPVVPSDVTPTNPGENTPVVYVKTSSLTTKAKHTVHYVYSDGRVAGTDAVQEADFTRTVSLDKDRKVVYGEWTSTNAKKNLIITPTIKGYSADKAAAGKTVLVADENDDEKVVYSPIIDPVKKLTSQTVTYVGAGDKTPKPDVQNNHIFTGNHDESTDTTTWEEKDHTYGEVTTPVVSGYYADKQTAGHKTVTPDYPTATDQVTYKELGKVVPVDPEGHPIPGAKTPTYNNDPQDPTKGTTTPIPEVPGYTPVVPSDVTPTNPGEDTPVVYVPIKPVVKKTELPSKMVVHYEGAGELTPKNNEQTYLFVGESSTDPVTHATNTAWNETVHVYQNVLVPVIPGYYAETALVHGQAASPEKPDFYQVVVYKPLGKIIPVDPQKTPIPEAPEPVFNNDQHDPTRAAETPVPTVPGYKPAADEPTVTPTHAGEDQPVIYVKNTDTAKKVSLPSQMLVHYKGAGSKTPADNRQVYLFTGEKSAAGQTSWNESSHTFGNVEVPTIPGYKAKISRIKGAVTTPAHPMAEFTVTYVKQTASAPTSPNGQQLPKKNPAVGSRDKNPNLPSLANGANTTTGSNGKVNGQGKVSSLSQNPAANAANGSLPQTGEKDSAAATVAGLLSLLASGALGLYSLTKKRKD